MLTLCDYTFHTRWYRSQYATYVLSILPSVTTSIETQDTERQSYPACGNRQTRCRIHMHVHVCALQYSVTCYWLLNITRDHSNLVYKMLVSIKIANHPTPKKVNLYISLTTAIKAQFNCRVRVRILYISQKFLFLKFNKKIVGYAPGSRNIRSREFAVYVQLTACFKSQITNLISMVTNQPRGLL